MFYQIVSPITATIVGVNMLDAVKSYVKLNHAMGITNLIVQDQEKRYNANIRYYNQDGRNKVGINMFPSSVWSTPFVVKDDTYIAPRYPDLLTPLSPVSVITPFKPIIVDAPAIAPPLPVVSTFPGFLPSVINFTP